MPTTSMLGMGERDDERDGIVGGGVGVDEEGPGHDSPHYESDRGESGVRGGGARSRWPQLEGAVELAGGLLRDGPSRSQHLAAGCVVQVGLREALGGDRIERRQTGVESVGESDRDRPVERDDRTLVDAEQHAVEVGDLAPVGARPRRRAELCVLAIAACSW